MPIRSFAVLLRDEPGAVDERVVEEQPLLDQQAERELDPVSPVLLQVGVLLRQVDDGPEQGELVGRVLAVALDDRIDLPEPGEFEGTHLW